MKEFLRTYLLFFTVIILGDLRPNLKKIVFQYFFLLIYDVRP